MASLASKVLLVTESAPDESSSMPPPNPPPAALPRASLSVSVQLLMLRAALSSSRMPPPEVAWPSVMVSPVMVTLALPLMSKTRLASLPLTESLLAPGPLIVTLSVIGKSLVSVMVPCRPLAKLMVSPLLAIGDGRPQRAGAAVGQVVHREGAEQAPVLQSFQARQDRSPRKGGS